ncbi:MAG: hypothetical protein KatS3mg085_320 [Candidatus Dojkabacteria bacterium]|nr:MAG: hypothetical protein KatS3mg085_320 [Candidatus Dojkabacteria bacterium]
MDNNIQITKELLAKYSFTFYAYDEKGEPLFTAPNGQIVGFNLVRNFIIEQENKLKQSQLVGSGGGIESMPKSAYS